MATKCRAVNATTCRVHGNGAAITAVAKALDKKYVSGNDRMKLMEMNERAANPKTDTKKIPVGISVEYIDGSSEVFLGSATDPYHATDYKFYSVDTGSSIEGVAYDVDSYDDIETGPLSVDGYKKEFASVTNEHLRLRSDDGEGVESSLLKVKKVTVL